MTTVYKPRVQETPNNNAVSIFLAGTIDNGDSVDWQEEITKKIKALSEKYPGSKDIIIYNPRRDNWDKGAGDEEMDYQINWELDRLQSCNLIIMNILGTSKSPISLMEIGLFASSNRIFVCCPEEFYRYKNVEVVCRRNLIPLVNDYAILEKQLLEVIEQLLSQSNETNRSQTSM